MTSTLYKRLKVDNGIKIYHYTGVCVDQIEVKELYQANWQPRPVEMYPERTAYSPPPSIYLFNIQLVSSLPRPKLLQVNIVHLEHVGPVNRQKYFLTERL
jgi:translation initiation factor 2A